MTSVLASNLTWDHSMAIHLGQSNRLQVCMTLGLGAYMHFHSSTCRISPCMDSSTHTKLRLWIPPPQDTEHAVQGLCSQLESKEIKTHYLCVVCLSVSGLQRWERPAVVQWKAQRTWSHETFVYSHRALHSSDPEATGRKDATSSLMPLHGAVLRTALVSIQSVKQSLNRLSTVNTNGQYYQRLKETEVRNQSSGCHRGFKFLTNCNAWAPSIMASPRGRAWYLQWRETSLFEGAHAT